MGKRKKRTDNEYAWHVEIGYICELLNVDSNVLFIKNNDKVNKSMC